MAAKWVDGKQVFAMNPFKTSCLCVHLSHNKGVFYCRRLFWPLLLVILAGCATPTPQPTPPDVDLSPGEPAVATKPPPTALVPAHAVPKPAAVSAPAHAAVPSLSALPDHFGPNETWVPLERWCQSYGFGVPRRISSEEGPAYAFSMTNGTMVLRIGSQLASWRGVDYHLGFAPRLVDGRPFVHALDIRKNLLPLLETAMPLDGNHLIVIDPGHGGTDAGASNVVNGHYEKEFTLDLARRLQAALAASGWNSLLTRTSDVTMSLPSRVAFAEQHKAALFISLHFNSAYPDRQESGLETYCLTPRGMQSTLTRGFADNAALTFPNNQFDVENVQFAACVQRELLKVNGHLDRGVRRARFLGVLREQNRPALLVECGFLSNPTEARKIADPTYREKVAEGIARALTEATGKPANSSIVAQTNSTPSAAPTAEIKRTNSPSETGLTNVSNTNGRRQQGAENE